MSPSRSTALPIAYLVLRIVVVLNRLTGAAILTVLIGTIVAKGWTFIELGIHPTSAVAEMIVVMQAVAVLVLIAIPLNDMVLGRLVAMVETVRRSDPFVAANAGRLKAIAWVLLALPLLSLVIGAIGRAASTPEHRFHFDAGFSASGWIAVLMAFVLARVFAEGTLMREDLEGTV